MTNCSEHFVESLSGAGGGCSFNRMPDNLLHRRFNFNNAFVMNDLPSNLRLKTHKIVVAIFLSKGTTR
jgi:hypothetical protein